MLGGNNCYKSKQDKEDGKCQGCGCSNLNKMDSEVLIEKWKTWI